METHWILGLSSRRRRVVPMKVPEGAEAGDEVGEGAFGLGPDLIGRGAIVSEPVLIVAVLIGVEVTLGLGCGELAGLADGTVRAISGRSPDDFRTVSGEILFALGRDVGGNAEGDGEVEGGAEHGVGDPGVTTGGVEQAGPPAEEIAAQSVDDDGRCGAILNRATGVEPFGFAEDLDAWEVACELVQSHEGCVADALKQRSTRSRVEIGAVVIMR